MTETLASEVQQTEVHAADVHYEEWGSGAPVLALHGLGLESSSFTGLAQGVNALGMRMLAVDLPGFGKTPAPQHPLTAAALAAPVIELARTLETPPIVMGMSLGARVALECALLAPEAFRGVVMMAAPLPRRKFRWLMEGARLLNPNLAKNIPIEIFWPWLKKAADKFEEQMKSDAEHDWMGRASKRAIYYICCPATRWAFVSAARELAMDPAFGPEGLWTRIGGLTVPAAFIWGDKDKIIPMDNVEHTASELPYAFQIHVPCAGHYNNGPHFICFEEGAVEGVRLVSEASQTGRRKRTPEKPRISGCLVEPQSQLSVAG